VGWGGDRGLERGRRQEEGVRGWKKEWGQHT